MSARWNCWNGLTSNNAKKPVHATGAVNTAPGATANFTFSTFADVQGGGTLADVAAYAPTPGYAGPLLQTGGMVESAEPLATTPTYQSGFAKIRLVLSRHQHYYERIVKQYSTGGVNRSIRYLTLRSANGVSLATPCST